MAFEFLHTALESQGIDLQHWFDSLMTGHLGFVADQHLSPIDQAAQAVIDDKGVTQPTISEQYDALSSIEYLKYLRGDLTSMLDKVHHLQELIKDLHPADPHEARLLAEYKAELDSYESGLRTALNDVNVFIRNGGIESVNRPSVIGDLYKRVESLEDSRGLRLIPDGNPGVDGVAERIKALKST